MEWINVKERLPKSFEVVWIYWRDKEVLLGCRTFEVDLTDDPSENWYSFSDEKARWTKWWMPVNLYSLDGPKAPKLDKIIVES